MTPARRVLLAAHDRGGVNLLMPLLRHWRERDRRIAASFIGAPMVAYELRHMLPSPVDIPATAGMRRDMDGFSRYDDAELSAILASTPWDLVLTGTSVRSDLEQSLWRLARARSMPTAALCDMWTEYARRFRDGAASELPDRILVLDDRMAEEARDALGASVAIDVVGSPHFADLLAAARRGDAGREHVRFISEPAAAIFPKAGVHEFQIAEMIIGVLERQGMASRLLLRPHPQDDAEAWRRFAAAHRTKGVRLDDEPSWSCHRSTAMAVGISSMMLIELAIAGVPVASFHPEGADDAYYCLPEKEFQIARLRSARDVEAWVRAPEPPRVTQEFIALHEPAVARITDVVLGGATGRVMMRRPVT